MVDKLGKEAINKNLVGIEAYHKICKESIRDLHRYVQSAMMKKISSK